MRKVVTTSGEVVTVVTEVVTMKCITTYHTMVVRIYKSLWRDNRDNHDNLFPYLYLKSVFYNVGYI
jgi:hypothetical protein